MTSSRTTDEIEPHREMKIVGVTEEEDEATLITPWSIVHLTFGAAMKELGVPLLLLEVGHGMYEFKDITVAISGGTYNSIPNSVGDQAIATLGWFLARRRGHLGRQALTFTAVWATIFYLGDRAG